jgi:hypothetical protein
MAKKKSKEKKAVKQVKKYYAEKKTDVTNKAATDTTRLQEDLAKVLADSGISQTRNMEDYIRNIGNIEANKGVDVAQLNDYVKTNTGRTQEDLNTSLAKETRRFSLERDQINQNLADKGLTFSERTPEKIAQESSRIATGDIQTEASRSFADIARYETAKNAEIQLKYGQQAEQAATTKTRTLEDILNDQQAAAQKINRNSQDVATALPIDIRDMNYAKNDAISTIGNYYDEQTNQNQIAAEKAKIQGV